MVKCVMQREVHGKRRRGKPKSNIIHIMTPRSSNIAKWMGENVEEITRDRAIYNFIIIILYMWGTLVRGAARHGRLIVIPDWTAEEEPD